MEPEAIERQSLLQSAGFKACIARFAIFNRCDSVDIQVR